MRVSPVIVLLSLLGRGDDPDLPVLRPDLLDDVFRGPGQHHVRTRPVSSPACWPAGGPGEQEESFQGRQAEFSSLIGPAPTRR